ncbi:MAG: hypothetical protein KGP27_15795 [Hyphomicrobiales bacterium]|nr:hypothetical protein [Hyphomicrobiales bacterium]
MIASLATVASHGAAMVGGILIGVVFLAGMIGCLLLIPDLRYPIERRWPQLQSERRASSLGLILEVLAFSALAAWMLLFSWLLGPT